MRKLIYIPIIHTEADMGSLKDHLKDMYIQKYGEGKWFEHLDNIDNLWKCIDEKIDTMNLCYKKVKIYQDGLPDCGIEEKIVDDIAKKGSRNHQLIVKLVNKGAKLVGTEDPKLLVEEYKTIQETFGKAPAESRDTMDNYKKRTEEQLSRRDKYISKRIDGTLRDKETGIIFIGMMHRLNDILPVDIKIEFLTPESAV